MAWLRGSTTVATAGQDIYDLLTGQIAAANTGGAGAQGTNGVQVAGVDAWTRLDAGNKVVRSKATQACLYGQWGFYRGGPRFEYRTTPPGTAMQLGTPTFTGAFSGTGRRYFQCYVSTSNTTAGSLTGLVVSWTQYDPATGSTLFSGTLSGWSGSSATAAIRDGISLTLTLGGSDILPSGSSAINWFRGYSATWTQGIDYFPDAGKIDNTQTIVMSSVSGGSNTYVRGTDYDLVGECDANPSLSSGALGSYCGNTLYGPGVMHGIHWRTGGAPPAAGTAVYLVSCQCFTAYAKVDFSGGSLTLQPCEYYDPTNALPRHCVAGDSAFGSPSGYPLVTPYNTPGSVLTTNFVNYWLSVKRDKIVIALRGDSSAAGNGTHGFGTFQKFTLSSYDTAEKTTWLVWSNINSGPFFASFAVAGRWPNDFPNGHTVFTNQSRQQWGSNSDLTYFGLASASIIGANPNAEDGKWWLYNLGVSSSRNGKDTAGTISLTRPAGIKGTLAGVFQISSDNWNDYDELVDGSNTYLLLQRGLYTSASSAFTAILEE